MPTVQHNESKINRKFVTTLLSSSEFSGFRWKKKNPSCIKTGLWLTDYYLPEQGHFAMPDD